MDTLLEQDELKYSLTSTFHEYTQVGIIYSLSIENADDLKVLDNNRKISNLMSKNHIKSLVKSFTNKGYLGIPIFVNEKLEVVDGQHRVQAWKLYCEQYPNNKFELLFIVLPNFDARSAQALNSLTHKRWTLQDHVDTFKSENKNYQIVSLFINKHQLGAFNSFMLLNGSYKLGGAQLNRIRVGDFMIDPEIIPQATKIAERFNDVFSDYPRFKSDRFVSTYLKFQAHPKFNEERFLNNWSSFWKDCLNGRSSEESLLVGLFEIQNGADRKGAVKIIQKTFTVL